MFVIAGHLLLSNYNPRQLYASGRPLPQSENKHPTIFGLPDPNKDDLDRTLASNVGSWQEIAEQTELANSSCRVKTSFLFQSNHTVKTSSCGSTGDLSTWSTSQHDGDIWLTIGNVEYQVKFYKYHGNLCMQLRLLPSHQVSAKIEAAKLILLSFVSER